MHASLGPHGESLLKQIDNKLLIAQVNIHMCMFSSLFFDIVDSKWKCGGQGYVLLPT